MSGSCWIEFGLHTAVHLDQRTQRMDAPTDEYENSPGIVYMMPIKHQKTEGYYFLKKLLGWVMKEVTEWDWKRPSQPLVSFVQCWIWDVEVVELRTGMLIQGLRVSWATYHLPVTAPLTSLTWLLSRQHVRQFLGCSLVISNHCKHKCTIRDVLNDS